MGAKLAIIFTSLLFGSLNCNSQNINSSDWLAIGTGFGKSFFLDQEFIQQFDNRTTLSTSVVNHRVFGPINEKREFYLDLGYSFPQELKQGDSINYKFAGAYLGIPWQTFRFQLIDGKKNDYKLLFSTPLYIGTDMGWMWLYQYKTYQQNFFLNVKVQIEPRLVLFQRLVIGTGLAISYDLTRPEWNTNENSSLNTVGFKNTAFSVNASLGWILRNKKQSKPQ